MAAPGVSPPYYNESGAEAFRKLNVLDDDVVFVSCEHPNMHLWM